MELKWCCEKPSLFPTHICTMFATVRSHLKVCDAKWTSQVPTATGYKLSDFEGLMEEEDRKRQREEREGMEKEGKEKEEKEKRNPWEMKMKNKQGTWMTSPWHHSQPSTHSPPPQMNNSHTLPPPVPNPCQQDCTPGSTTTTPLATMHHFHIWHICTTGNDCHMACKWAMKQKGGTGKVGAWVSCLVGWGE